MDRQQTEALFAEAQRLRSSLIEASTILSTFTQQLRDLLNIPDATDADDKEESREDHRR